MAEGEARAVIYFLGLFFLLGTGFALGRGSAGSLFLQRFGIERLPHAMAVLLAPESDAYQSASALVWRTLRKSGRDMSYVETEELGSTAELAAAGESAPGAVAIYYDGEMPYHAGIVDAGEAITSATLNAGVVTLPADAFPGEIRYRRVAPSPKSQVADPKATGVAPP